MGSFGGIRQYKFICIFVYLNHLKSICVFVYLCIRITSKVFVRSEKFGRDKAGASLLSLLSLLPPLAVGKGLIFWNVECLLITIPGWVGLRGERSRVGWRTHIREFFVSLASGIPRWFLKVLPSRPQVFSKS